MDVTVNGENRAIGPELTVAALLVELGLDARQVAVERNCEIVPKATYAQTTLQGGDRLEIVTFVGGG